MAVKSAFRVLEILELLSKYKGGLAIKDISEKLNIPQSSTSNLVKTLYDSGYITQGESKKYILGVHLIQLGTIAMESFDISVIAKPILKKLVEKVQETVFLAIRSQNEVVYIVKIDSNRSTSTSAQPGYRKPLHSTGLGKVFLSFMPQEERDEVLSTIELSPITSKTITDKNILIKQLDEAKINGYAIDDEEGEYRLYCIAAPVWILDKNIQAAISVAGEKERMIRNKDNIIQCLLDSSNEISRNFGGKFDINLY